MRATIRRRPQPVYLGLPPRPSNPDDAPPNDPPPFVPSTSAPAAPASVPPPPAPPRIPGPPPLPAWDAAARARAVTAMTALARTQYRRTLSAATAARFVALPTHGAAWAAFHAWGRAATSVPPVIKLPPATPAAHDVRALASLDARVSAGMLPDEAADATVSVTARTSLLSNPLLLGGAALALFLVTRSDKKK